MQKQIEDDNFNPFYKNAVEKYFDKPTTDKFETFIYFKYHVNYKIDTVKNKLFTADGKQLFKKKKPMLIKTTQRRLCDKNTFFYNRLFY